MDQCKAEYDEWVKLLKELGREEFLQDTYAVWQEAWHVSRIKNELGLQHDQGKS